MEVKELIEIFNSLSAFGTGAVIGGIIVLFLLKSFLPSYLKEKGKHLASKEDVTEITKKVESIKYDYELSLQKTISRESLRGALVDKRMEAHQSGYQFSHALINNAESDHETRTKLESEYLAWYISNCLYLDDNPREKVAYIYSCFKKHEYRSTSSGSSPSVDDDENLKSMKDTLAELSNEFKLPPIL